jgi:hypothetical protein
MSVVLIALTLLLIGVFAFHAVLFFRKTCEPACCLFAHCRSHVRECRGGCCSSFGDV